MVNQNQRNAKKLRRFLEKKSDQKAPAIKYDDDLTEDEQRHFMTSPRLPSVNQTDQKAQSQKDPNCKQEEGRRWNGHHVVHRDSNAFPPLKANS